MPNNKNNRSLLERALVTVILAVALSACQSTGMSALAPAGAQVTSGASLSVVFVQGPAAEQASKFEAILIEEAKKRGFAIAGTDSTAPTMRLKAYLDAFSGEGGKAGFAWVFETSDDGKTRAIRVKGAAEVSSPGATPWSAFDEAAMRQVAGLGIDDLIRQASGASAVASANTEETQ